MMSDTDKETSLLLQEPSANSDANSNANSNVGDDGGESDAVVAPSTERSSSLVGFADGFSTWSDSLQAFHLAIFHGILYVGIGIVFYSFILETKLTIIESVYFSMTLLTTVGYGDISPDSSNAGMIFTILFALYGIIILGIFLGILGDMLVERQETKKEEVMKLASDAYLDTMLDKRPKAIDDELAKDSEHSFMYDVYKIAREQRVNIMVLFILAIPVIVLEKWGFVKGFYWIIITGSTIGLGDEHPTHEWSKLLCIVYLPLSVAFAGAFLGNIATCYVDKRNDAMEAQFLNRALNESALEKMDSNHDDKVTKDEFLVYMLKTLAKVDPSDIDKILELFYKLDKDKTGSLTKADIRFIPVKTAKLHRESIQKS